ncbi:unnamed protein product, partial [Callosobruchus maculatus]
MTMVILACALPQYSNCSIMTVHLKTEKLCDIADSSGSEGFDEGIDQHLIFVQKLKGHKKVLNISL